MRLNCDCGYSEAANPCPKCGGDLHPESEVGARESAAVAAGTGGSTAATRPCSFCGEPILASAIKCRHCGERFSAMIPGTWLKVDPSIEPDDLLREYRQLNSLRLKSSLVSFAFGAPAVLLTILPWCLMGSGDRLIFVLGPATGVALFAVSYTFAARYKGRNPAWATVALLSILGLLVIGGLKDVYAERLLVLKAMLMLLGKNV